MTIASEITRLQGAKASAKASIISKGVNVPDNASVADYHTYIDQIQTGSPILTNGLTLNNIYVTGYDCRPGTTAVYSFDYNGKIYGVCGVDENNSSRDFYKYGVYTFSKAQGSDFSYKFTTGGGQVGDYYGYSVGYRGAIHVWRKDNLVRCYVFAFYSPSTGADYWNVRKADWNLTTDAVSVEAVGAASNPDTYTEDVEGYTRITEQKYIASATGNEINDNGYIYLTLK